ncbi:MAG: FapA family protein [Oscillospiraceae bacterium]|nr:FapA family protein [Oscillospiraceae bacterium]
MDELANHNLPEEAPIDSVLSVTISSDGMSADITATEPQNGGAAPTVAAARAALAQKGVVYGIDEEALVRLASSAMYGLPVTCARGVPPVHGEAAVVRQLIHTDNDLRPKELADGSVDFKDLGIVHSVRAGELLCEKKPATPGTPGTNVLGNTVPAKPGKDVPLPAGKGTTISPDKLQLLAAYDGQADMVNRKIQVLNTFTVRGDVCNATGNIDFVGNVVVEGSVLTGFSVQATGNVTINGSVESAQIIAGGNITLKGGINGSGKGMVKAGGYVKTKYIQSGTVHAAGDIESSYILHSVVQSGGGVTLLGKGTIIGGNVCAMKYINAAMAGSRNTYVPTILEVGTDPGALNRSREIPKELEANKRDSMALLRVINLLGEYKKANRITPDKLQSLHRAIASYQALAQTALELEDEQQHIQEALAAAGRGAVNITGAAYPGVRIVIGSDTLPLESKFDHCSFARSESGIQMMPLKI